MNRDDIPIGRPLWQMELRKVVPAPTNYDVKREFSDAQPNKSGSCTFGNGYDKYQKKCDIDRGIKVFDYNSKPINPGYLKPLLSNTKK